MRKATSKDIDALSEIYYRTVDIMLRAYYEEPQINYYLSFSRNYEKFGKFIFEPETWVLDSGNKLVGFGGLEENGHITSLYIDPDHTRKGVGTSILKWLIESAQKRNVTKIYTEANPLSKNFFIKNGFHLIGEETRYRNSVPFIRYNMAMT